MDRGWIAIGILLLTLVGAAIGYVVASAVLTFRTHGLGTEVDFFLVAETWPTLRRVRPDDARLVTLLVGGFAAAGLLLSAVLSGTALTRFGRTRWQTRGQMRRNGFFAAPGTGFVLGKMGRPGSHARLVASKTFPHALIVAPTGRGKTTGFVIPNLLTFKGSAVVLDVKGESFAATARHRATQGDAVYRFAPVDWSDRRTHRYNPLLRIAGLADPSRTQMELQLLATLFLQTDDRTQGLLKGGIDLFVAAGLLAFERGTPTLGEIYRITASGGDKRKEFLMRRDEVRNRAAKLIFERMGSTNNDTLTSYISLLMTSGLDQWANPAVDAATSVSDFDFRTIRKAPFSVYLVVAPNLVKPMAPLIRLFFSDLISALQDKEPGPDEPWPVMIILDEFNRLGKVPIVVESIETLRTYNGRLAIVTQSIPALDEIYGENTRRALQANAGVKLYLTPSDEKTVEEMSKAVGKTTKRVVTRSRSIGRNPFEGRSLSERTEETPLLTEDEARRMSLDDIVMVVDAQMPVRTRRIRYFDDPYFRGIAAAQTGDLPFPGAAAADAAEFAALAVTTSDEPAKGEPPKPWPRPSAIDATPDPLPRPDLEFAVAGLPPEGPLQPGQGKTMAIAQAIGSASTRVTVRRKRSARALRETAAGQGELYLPVQQVLPLTGGSDEDAEVLEQVTGALAVIGAKDRPDGPGPGQATLEEQITRADALHHVWGHKNDAERSAEEEEVEMSLQDDLGVRHGKRRTERQPGSD